MTVAGGRSILLVEDHAESRASLAYVLEKRGETVHQAANGRAALSAARPLAAWWTTSPRFSRT